MPGDHVWTKGLRAAEPPDHHVSAGLLLGGLCCHGVVALGKVLTPGEKCTFLVREATGQPLAPGSTGLFAFPPAGGQAGPAPRAPQLDGLHLLQLLSSELLLSFDKSIGGNNVFHTGIGSDMLLC